MDSQTRDVLKGDFCKWLLFNSQTDDLRVLAEILRAVFNLFFVSSKYLKVQLEVFIQSVHLRLLPPPPPRLSEEQYYFYEKRREMAMDSLLTFCYEPGVLHAMYVNYDCDLEHSNLFEMIIEKLVESTGAGGVVGAKAAWGVLAVVDSIGQRCRDGPMSSKLQGETLKARKIIKSKLSRAAEEFNADNKNWIQYCVSLNIIKDPQDPKEVAAFLYSTSGVDKTKLGEYLSKGPEDKYPFNAKVLSSYVELFDFSSQSFSQSLRCFLLRFRLPGEAQCIDRLMEAFAHRLYKCFTQGEDDQGGAADVCGKDDQVDTEEVNPENTTTGKCSFPCESGLLALSLSFADPASLPSDSHSPSSSSSSATAVTPTFPPRFPPSYAEVNSSPSPPQPIPEFRRCLHPFLFYHHAKHRPSQS